MGRGSRACPPSFQCFALGDRGRCARPLRMARRVRGCSPRSLVHERCRGVHSARALRVPQSFRVSSRMPPSFRAPQDRRPRAVRATSAAMPRSLMPHAGLLPEISRPDDFALESQSPDGSTLASRRRRAPNGAAGCQRGGGRERPMRLLACPHWRSNSGFGGATHPPARRPEPASASPAVPSAPGVQRARAAACRFARDATRREFPRGAARCSRSR